MFGLVVPCSFSERSPPSPVPRFRQVSDGGLHLQGEQHKQRGDLALTDLQVTHRRAVCMHAKQLPTVQLSKGKTPKTTAIQPSIRRLQAGSRAVLDLAVFLGRGGPRAVSAPSVARP